MIAITGAQTLLFSNADWMASISEATWALPFFAVVETILLFMPTMMRWTSPTRDASAASVNDGHDEEA